MKSKQQFTIFVDGFGDWEVEADDHEQALALFIENHVSVERLKE